METNKNEDKKPLESEIAHWPESHISAKTNLMEMNRKELEKVVRNLFELLDRIENGKLN